MHLANAVLDQRQVPVGVVDSRLVAGYVCGEPLTVAARDETVVAALEDEHRAADRAEVEAPVRDEREVVVDPAVAGRLEPVVVGLANPLGEDAGEDGLVGCAEERCEDPLDLRGARLEHVDAVALDRRPKRLFAREHEVELFDVLLAHSG